MSDEERARTRAINRLYSSFKARDAQTSLDQYSWIVNNAPGEKLPLQCYNGLLKALATEGSSAQCEAVLADMEAVGVSLTEASYSALVQAHVNSGQLSEAARVLERLRRENIEPRLRTYAPLITALCEKRRAVEARSLWREMTTDYDVVPTEDMFSAMLESLAASASEPEPTPSRDFFISEFCSVLREMEHSLDGMPANKLEEIHEAVASSWSSATCAAGEGRIRAEFVTLDPADGSCSLTGVERLPSPGLDAAERRKVRSRLLDVAAAASRRQFEELDRFANWLDDHPWRFTAVVDGPNVAYYNQNFEGGCFSVAQLKKVVQTLEDLGHIVLVVMPAKYCESVIPNHSKRPRRLRNDTGDANKHEALMTTVHRNSTFNSSLGGGGGGTPKQTLSDEDQEALSVWASRGALYSVPRGCHDDMYWMLATVAGAAPIAVTNDRIRDHWHKLVGSRQHKRWSRAKIVRFDLTLDRTKPIQEDPAAAEQPDHAWIDENTKAHLSFPPNLARQVHRTSLPTASSISTVTAWHIPDTEGSDKWLCLRVTHNGEADDRDVRSGGAKEHKATKDHHQDIESMPTSPGNVLSHRSPPLAATRGNDA